MQQTDRHEGKHAKTPTVKRKQNKRNTDRQADAGRPGARESNVGKQRDTKWLQQGIKALTLLDNVRTESF